MGGLRRYTRNQAYLAQTSRRGRAMTRVQNLRIAARNVQRGMNRGVISAGRRRQFARAAANQTTMGLLGIEKKYLDTANAGQVVSIVTNSTAGEVDPSVLGCSGCLSAPATGDGPSNRDGNRIVAKDLYVKGALIGLAAKAVTDPPAPTRVMVAIVLDTQTNGAQLNSEDVFTNLTGAAIGQTTPLRNMLFRDRFRVLKQEVFDVSAVAITQAGATANNYSWSAGAQIFEWYFDLKNMVINLQNTAADVANVIDNSLHVIAFAQGGNSPITIAYNARMRFVG